MFYVAHILWKTEEVFHFRITDIYEFCGMILLQDSTRNKSILINPDEIVHISTEPYDYEKDHMITQ